MRFAIFIFFIFSGLGFSIQQTGNTLAWDESRQLNWSDFKAKPEKSSPYLALTTSGIYFSFTGTLSDLKAEVKAYFDPASSWKKETMDALLMHEQWHFNITEIFARKMRKEISGMKLQKSNFKQQLSGLHTKINRDCQAYQRMYDKETDHSKNSAKQKEWESKLAAELKELGAYTTTSIGLKVQN